MWAEATEQSRQHDGAGALSRLQGRVLLDARLATSFPSRCRSHIPPIWLACSNRETIHVAARNGVGALAFAFVDPAEAAKWAGEYYEIIKSEACVPIGHCSERQHRDGDWLLGAS